MLNLRLTALAAACALLAACASTPKPLPLPPSDTPMSIEADNAGGYKVLAPDGVTQVGTVTGLPPPPVPAAPVESAALSASQSFPINAKPGECYARVVSPPKFETRSEKMLAKAETERIEIIPATFEVVEEKVLVKLAARRSSRSSPPSTRPWKRPWW